MKGFASFCVRTSVMSPKTMKRIGKIAPVMIANTFRRRQDSICVLRLNQKAPSHENLINAHHSKKEKNRVCLVAVLVQLCQSHLRSHSHGHHYPVNIKKSRHNGCLYTICRDTYRGQSNQSISITLPSSITMFTIGNT